MPTLQQRTLAASIALCLFSFTHASAIDQTVGNQSWLNAVWGSPAVAPVTGYPYASANGFILRSSPEGSLAGGDSDFPGDTLTIVEGTLFLLKQTSGQVASLDSGSGNLILDGGRITAGPNSGSNSVTLDVNQLILQTNSTIELNNAAATLTIDGTLTGPGGLTLKDGDGSDAGARKVIFTAVSDFTGSLDITESVDIEFGSNYDFTNTFSLSSGSVFTVNQTFRFFAEDLTDPTNGEVAPGTYTGASLTALGANYVDGGGAIIVSSQPRRIMVMSQGFNAAGGYEITYSGLDTSSVYDMKRSLDLQSSPDFIIPTE